MNTTPPQSGPAQLPPPPPPREPWRFVRRERGRMIAGVATGMADAFHIDIIVMRVIWVIATIATGGLGILAYAICWIAFPSDEHPAPMTEIRDRNYSAAVVAGLAALAIGFMIVFGQLLSVHPFRHGGLGLATLLIGGGLAVLFLRHHDRDRDDSDHTPPASRTDTYSATRAPVASEGPVETAPADAAAAMEEPPTTASAWSQHSPWPAPPAPPSPPSFPSWARPPSPRTPRRPRRRPFLTPLTISLLLIGGGAAALLDSTGAVHLTLAGALAAGLIVVGGALVVSAWFGRARGLIPIGVLVLLAAIPAAAIDVPISGGIGERRYHPATRAELRRNYELGIGQVVLDLRDAPLSGRVTRISGSLGIGELAVDVPADVRVDVRAHVGAGTTEIFGRPDDGWPQDTHQVTGRRQRGVLYLDLRVGAGSIHVRRWSADGAFVAS